MASRERSAALCRCNPSVDAHPDRHAKIPTPIDVYGPRRQNSAGLDLSVKADRERLALRQARQAQRQAAEHGARQSIALTNEVARLSEHNRQLRNRLDELENGQVIVALGQQLMALRAEYEALLAAAHRVCSLNQALHATRREGERLARARDDALDCLYDCTIQPVTP